MKKGFYHPTAIIILAVITLSFALIFYINSKYLLKPPQPSPPAQVSPIPSASPKQSPADETANWKTYTNNQYKFLLKYPPNLTIQKLGNEDPQTLSLASDDFGLGIIVFKPESYTGLSEPEEIMVDGVKASKQIEKDYKGDLQQVTVHILKNGLLYQVISPFNGKTNEKETLKTFDQILSTFQFLN